MDKTSIQDAGLRETCDLTPTPIENRVEKEVSASSQRIRRPPAWLGDLVSGGDLDQSLTSSQDHHASSLNQIMAQQQSDQPPLDIQDMWRLSDEEDRQDKRLPGDGLDISWVAAETKSKVTNQFYELTASES